MTTESFPVMKLIKNDQIIYKGSEVGLYDYITEKFNISVDEAVKIGFMII
jgi:hypothetical protein